MEGHLSPDQLMNVLSERGTPEGYQHVEVCNQCAEKIAGLRATLSMFGESVQRWVDHKSRATSPDAAFVRVSGGPTPMRLRFALGAAAVLLAIVIPLYWHVPGNDHKSDVLEDTLLLEEIHAQLSREVPGPMEPLMKMISDPASRDDGRDQ
jgi:hypothetical protein